MKPHIFSGEGAVSVGIVVFDQDEDHSEVYDAVFKIDPSVSLREVDECGAFVLTFVTVKPGALIRARQILFPRLSI